VAPSISGITDAWIWQMREGKALLLQAYSDPQQALDALGLSD
jgi:ketosteroid isomerase-like protein